jgi:hypothetical protein
MRRIALIYGSIAGAVSIGTAVLGMSLGESAHLAGLEWLGYLVMLVALALVFVGVKQYRDEHGGGVIRFVTALKVGLGIVLVAAVVYVLVWEVYLAATGYGFMEEYVASVLEERAAAGASPAELEAARTEMAEMAARYERAPARMLITSLEILPIGILVALVSAAVLRRPEVLPAA